MKKIILSAVSILFVGSIVFISCKSKNDNDAITPTYKDEAASGTGNNPNITNVTTTGTVATTSSANQNSQMTGIGITGSWSGQNCSIPAPTCISQSNSSLGTTVEVCFSSSPVVGFYTLVNTQAALGPGKAWLKVTNPTSQPTGTTWFSSGGQVEVQVGTTSTTVLFNNISCLQAGTNFPVVTVSGQVGCL
jgi:hypothetical protein